MASPGGSEAGIVHRDLKTKNIMIAERLAGKAGTVKVLDFGLAKQSGIGTVDTQSGAVLGTPAYMSPEQAKGEPADYRSDIFSFGVILYEIACGQRPFGGPDLPSTLYAVVHHDPPTPDKLNPSLPKPLAGLIERCLSKNPEDRPESMEAVRRELAGVTGQFQAGAPKPRRIRRRTAIVADLDGIIDGFAHGQRGTGQPLSQRLALQQFGSDIKHAAVGAGIINDHDVGVIERRGRAPFLLKTEEPLRIADESHRKNLQRNVAPQPGIASAIHLPFRPHRWARRIS